MVPKVAFIPKVERNDYVLAKAFRPICLSSFLSKTMEILIPPGILVTRALDSHHRAYRAGRSMEPALYYLTNLKKNSLEVKELALFDPF